jgi:hypothetical protein
MRAVTLQDGHYVVIVPEARCVLVLTKEQFVDGLQRAKHWKRRQRQADREAQAACIVVEKRSSRLQAERSS